MSYFISYKLHVEYLNKQKKKNVFIRRNCFVFARFCISHHQPRLSGFLVNFHFPFLHTQFPSHQNRRNTNNIRHCETMSINQTPNRYTMFVVNCTSITFSNVSIIGFIET